ncbi:MAG: folylpolyglutamate synthase/dihydrofolate synthase family protein [Bacteroidota bacterium]
MDYNKTLAYLFERLPMFTRIGAAALKPDLTNTIALCNILGNPEDKFKTIHIAGTNGKGSTSHMLASILQESGLKTGLYTSPHLTDFRERIRINGKMIPEQNVIEFVAKYKTDFEPINSSFFEWTVALCFDYFANEKVDVAIIETGLGGRLDSTNIITPLLSVITNIGWDHTDLLGNTLAKIAYEKAGIIKTKIPIIIGESNDETKPVFDEISSEINAPISYSEDIFETKNFISHNTFSVCDIYKNGEVFLEKLKLELAGNYQQKNMLTVLNSIEHLRKSGFNITDENIRKGLLNVKNNTGLAGRWQILGENPLIICDTGHNVNGIEMVVTQLKQNKYEKLHMVIGMVKDKDISKVLSILPKDAEYYFCNAAIPRSLPSEELRTSAQTFGLKGHHYATVAEALKTAKSNAGLNDLVFVGGSTFVVAEILSLTP